MTDNGQIDLNPDDEKSQRPRGRWRYPWAMLVVILLFVVLPFLSWYGTWFGRPLSDKQMAEYLDDKEKPRHTQQALERSSIALTGMIHRRPSGIRK